MPDESNARRLQEALTLGYAVLLLTVFLFGWGTAGYTRIMQGKFWIYTVICGAYALLMAGIGAYRLAKGELRPISMTLSGAGWGKRLAAAYLLLTWISAVCSKFWPETVLGISRYEGALSISMYVISFLLVSSFGGLLRRRLGQVLWLLGGALCLFCGLCAVQLEGGDPLGLYPNGLSYLDKGIKYPGAYLGTIGNVDLVAAFLSLALPVLLAALLHLEGKRRLLLLIPLGLGLYVALRMGVLAGYLGIGAGCALAVPAALRDRRHRRLAVLIIAGAGALALLLVYLFDFGGTLLHQAHELLHGNVDPGFGSGRIYIWQEVAKRLPEGLLLGHGPDTMLRAGMEFRHYSERLGREAVSAIDTAHCEYLNVLYHQGLPALAAYLGLLAAAARRWAARSREDGAVAALGAGLAGYCVQACFGFSMTVTAPFFWLALALIFTDPSDKTDDHPFELPARPGE